MLYKIISALITLNSRSCFRLLPPHWDARFCPEKRVPKLKTETQDKWKRFVTAYPNFRKHFKGVSKEMMPLLEEFFGLRIEAYKKVRDRRDPTFCKYFPRGGQGGGVTACVLRFHFLFSPRLVIVEPWYDSEKPLDTPTLRLAVTKEENHCHYIQDFALYQGLFQCGDCFKLYTVSIMKDVFSFRAYSLLCTTCLLTVSLLFSGTMESRPSQRNVRRKDECALQTQLPRGGQTLHDRQT